MKYLRRVLGISKQKKKQRNKGVKPVLKVIETTEMVQVLNQNGGRETGEENLHGKTFCNIKRKTDRIMKKYSGKVELNLVIVNYTVYAYTPSGN